jgi:hypothetical protein
MARPTATVSLFNRFMDQLSAAIAQRINGRGGAAAAPAAKGRKGRKGSKLAGRKLDMSCRVAGCKNVSGGPRHGFMCAEHQKLPKKEQMAARDAWKAKHAV